MKETAGSVIYFPSKLDAVVLYALPLKEKKTKNKKNKKQSQKRKTKKKTVLCFQ